MNEVIVSKFGGTSVQDANAIRNVCSIVSNRNEKTFIVVSALSKVTDTLISLIEKIKNKEIEEANRIVEVIFERHFKIASELEIARETEEYFKQKQEELNVFSTALGILGEVTNRSVDYILSFGELLSSFLVFVYLRSRGLDIAYIDPRNIIKTDSNYTCAEVDFNSTKKALLKELSKFSTQSYWITGGFVGSDSFSNTTTLGRGGSDYSASVIASIVGAKVLEIWTDVDGILTADPKIVMNAKLLKEVSYDEASELAIFGAKVLHPKTIFPAVAKKIPVYVLNTFNPSSKGTLISHRSSKRKVVKGIAYRKNVTVINIKSNRMLGAYGYLAKVFDIFNKFQTSVDLVSTSEVSISLTIDDPKNLDKILFELSKISNVEVFDNCCIVSIIGEGLKDSTTIASRIFNVLKNTKILMVSMGSSDINFSFVVRGEDLEKTVVLLHKEFFENLNGNDIL